MLALASLLLALAVNHSGTPEAVALRVLYPPENARATVVRTNVLGRFATVLIRHGIMEGWSVDAPILLEHFSFGWQPIDVLNDRFCPGEHGISLAVEQTLMKGMPQPKATGHVACPEIVRESSDTGPVVKVEAVRRLIGGPVVPHVYVWQNYAMGEHFGAGGGDVLFAYRQGSWHRLRGGGGPIGIAEIRRYAIPQAGLCALRVFNARCPFD